MRWQASLPLLLLIAAAPFEQTGPASWYGDELKGNRTANGERFDPQGMTAAHRTLKMGSWVDVTSLDNGRTVRVRINDRGPFHSNRVLDLSAGAARKLGMMGHGARLVRIRAVDQADPTERGLLDAMRRANDWTPPPGNRQEAIGEGPYFVQLATFESHSRAESLAARYDAGLDKSGGLWRVRVGPLTGAREVNAALARLAANGYPGAILVR